MLRRIHNKLNRSGSEFGILDFYFYIIVLHVFLTL